jgi:hypothetical protein
VVPRNAVFAGTFVPAALATLRIIGHNMRKKSLQKPAKIKIALKS